jgi:methenyltetrahydromethanopterin cyclohydrolase
MISVNRRAAELVRQMIGDSEALGVSVGQLDDGATVVDAGVNASGSLEAGRLFAAACMGGLAQVGFTEQAFERVQLPAVAVTVSHPPVACMASQYAGWSIKLGSYSAIGSGPARALYANEELYRKIDYRDRSETAILMLEGPELPSAQVTSYVAKKCGVQSEHLAVLVAPTASLVGSVQIAARSAETGMHKMAELGFDVRKVIAAFGLCPLAPVASDDLRAIGRTNDAILYGSHVSYTVRAEDEELCSLIEKIPSSSSCDYGTPFCELFRQYQGDFFRIDKLLFSPAQVEINNLTSGRVFRAGRVNPSLIEASLLES